MLIVLNAFWIFLFFSSRTDKESSSRTYKEKAMQDFPYFGSSQLDTWNYVPLGRHRFMEWKDGDSPFNITTNMIQYSDALARERRDSIKEAMRHSWEGYRACAFGKDEVAPQTCEGKDKPMYGISTTLVDSLDTLWLMDMKDEFYEARDWIRDNLQHDYDRSVSVFENTIRSLGGLLSAYDWSGDKMFLEKAVDIGDRLFKAFDSPTGIPFSFVNLKTGKGENANWNRIGTSIAQAGTLQVEFRFLSKVTGNKTYAEKAEAVFEQLHALKRDDGLYFSQVSNLQKDEKHRAKSGVVSFGGEGGKPMHNLPFLSSLVYSSTVNFSSPSSKF